MQTTFAPSAFRPWQPVKMAHPAFMASSLRESRLAQASVREVVGVGSVVGLLGTALGAATSYVGFRTGVKESGFLSVLGWIVGISGGMFALTSLAGTVMLLAAGSAVANEQPQQQQQQQTVMVPRM